MKAFLRTQFDGKTPIPAKLTSVDNPEDQTTYNGTDGLEILDMRIGKEDILVRLNARTYKGEITNFDIK